MSIPRWLQQHLTDLGRWNADGISRALRAKLCRCGARVLRGLDDDTAGVACTVEANPIDASEELLALMQGWNTYRLGNYAGQWEIDHRTSMDIAAQPAGSVDVLVQHKCGQPFPCNGPPINNPRPARAAIKEDACPY